ncbi:MAG: SpoIIE family protein phosphatase, partial [Ilumatobacteraceae bacterium]
MNFSASPGDASERAAQYDQAACGLLTTDRDGHIVDVNQTLLDWLGATRDETVGRRRFIDLLSGGGRIYHETHFAPLVGLQGWAREVAFDLRCADGSDLPALVNARLRQEDDTTLIDIAVFGATERRMYERELLIAKQRAERSEFHAQLLARTLQDTLLPHDVPAIPGLEIAAAYLPAGEGHDIGGDFYDMFQIAADEWVIAIGDVEGKGVAAAIVTALVRHTIRAAAVEHGPAGVLRLVNRVLLASQSNRYCTAAVLRCNRNDDVWSVTVACGGHPLPILA